MERGFGYKNYYDFVYIDHIYLYSMHIRVFAIPQVDVLFTFALTEIIQRKQALYFQFTLCLNHDSFTHVYI